MQAMSNLTMKNLLFTTALLLGLATATNAQILDPRKVLKRKATDRTNQKIDQSIDKA